MREKALSCVCRAGSGQASGLASMILEMSVVQSYIIITFVSKCLMIVMQRDMYSFVVSRSSWVVLGILP